MTLALGAGLHISLSTAPTLIITLVITLVIALVNALVITLVITLGTHQGKHQGKHRGNRLIVCHYPGESLGHELLNSTGE